MNFLKKKIIELISYVFASCVDLNIFYLKKIYKNKLVTLNNISFGDSWRFYIDKYNEINNSNKKIIIFSINDERVVEFFFQKKNYIKILIPIPLRLSWVVAPRLRKFKNFKSVALVTAELNNYNYSENQRKLINYKLKKKKISEEVKQLRNSNYITFFIKHYNSNPKDLRGSSPRQTSNVKKIFEILKFLINKDLKILVLGNDLDKGTSLIKRLVKKKQKEKIIFFKEISENYSLADQIFAIQNSVGYIGSASAPAEIALKLKKKVLIFDRIYDDTSHYKLLKKGDIEKIYYNKTFKNLKILYKYIQIKNNRPKILKSTTIDRINDKNFNIFENNSTEIKLNIQKLFNF